MFRDETVIKLITLRELLQGESAAAQQNMLTLLRIFSVLIQLPFREIVGRNRIQQRSSTRQGIE